MVIWDGARTHHSHFVRDYPDSLASLEILVATFSHGRQLSQGVKLFRAGHRQRFDLA